MRFLLMGERRKPVAEDRSSYMLLLDTQARILSEPAEGQLDRTMVPDRTKRRAQALRKAAAAEKKATAVDVFSSVFRASKAMNTQEAPSGHAGVDEQDQSKSLKTSCWTVIIRTF